MKWIGRLLLTVGLVVGAGALAVPSAFAKKPGGGGGTPSGVPSGTDVIWTADSQSGGALMGTNSSNGATGTLLDGVNHHFAWNGDGTGGAFYRVVSGAPGIYTIGLDGTGLQQVVSVHGGDGLDISRVATPDGAVNILYTDLNNIYAIEPDGSNQVQLTFATGNDAVTMPSVSPDGTQFVASRYYDGGDRYLVLFDLGTDGGGRLTVTGETQLTGVTGSPLTADYAIYEASWSNDGTRVVVRAFYTVSPSNDLWWIDMGGDPTADQVQLTNAGSYRGDPCYRADDGRVFHVAPNSTKGNAKMAIYSIDADQSGSRVALGGGAPQYQPACKH